MTFPGGVLLDMTIPREVTARSVDPRASAFGCGSIGSARVGMEGPEMRLAIACALAVVLLTGCIAKRDMDECRKGDRSRCPGEGSGLDSSRPALASR